MRVQEASNKAQQVEGRIIHMTLSVRLVPPESDDLGETDMAMAIGQGLIYEAAQMLKRMGEAEGFTVEIEARHIVY